MGFGFDFGLMGVVVPCFVFGLFVAVIVLLIVNGVRGASRWHQNNQSPVLTVEAAVVTKRGDVRRHTHNTGVDNGMMHTTTSTTYYATFQVESGDRMELLVPREEYGLLVEGDQGKLTFQGTRYLGFARAY